jgi:hypothetical protein
MVRNLGINIVFPDLGSFPEHSAYSKIYVNLGSDKDPRIPTHRKEIFTDPKKPECRRNTCSNGYTNP